MLQNLGVTALVEKHSKDPLQVFLCTRWLDTEIFKVLYPIKGIYAVLAKFLVKETIMCRTFADTLRTIKIVMITVDH